MGARYVPRNDISLSNYTCTEHIVRFLTAEQADGGSVVVAAVFVRLGLFNF
jgi:hypothetical protein